MHSYRLSTTAELDLRDILEYTLERFGQSQMLQYNANLISCLEAMTQDSSLSHYKRFKEIESSFDLFIVKNTTYLP